MIHLYILLQNRAIHGETSGIVVGHNWVQMMSRREFKPFRNLAAYSNIYTCDPTEVDAGNIQETPSAPYSLLSQTSSP